MKVEEIIVEYLDKNGYDGLFSQDGECACEKNDLAPCEHISLDCRVGYKTECDCEEEHDFHISAKKEKTNGQ